MRFPPVPVLLVMLLVVALPAAAFEFPFHVIRFGPQFQRMSGDILVLRYPADLPRQEELPALLARTEEELRDFARHLGIETGPGQVIVSLYRSSGQKRKLTGNVHASHLEDGQVHRLFTDGDTVIGDALVALAARRLGPCSRSFLQTGIRYQIEPCLPDWSLDSLETGFYHAGLLRHPGDLFREENHERFDDVRSRVTAASFVRFLLSAYPADSFRQFYRHCGRDFAAAFAEAYGFSFEDARIQWLERLSGAHLPRTERHRLESALIAVGVRVHP